MPGGAEVRSIDVIQKAEITIIDERTIRDRIYEVRGVKVMLDFELAEIYGYTTKAFNQQVKNNIDKFDEDFRFQLTKEELDELSRSKKLTLNKGQGRGSNIKYRPWCFTESGVYMLMTVLKGELATKQTKALIRFFRSMKDYIVNTEGLAYQRDLLRISMQTTENTEAIRNLYNKLHAGDYADFLIEFPAIPITFITTAGIMHDRYIVLDYDEPDEIIFLCGSSSKDSGVTKMSTIVELKSSDVKNMMHSVIDKMKLNPELVLR